MAALPERYGHQTTTAESALIKRLLSFDGAVPPLVKLLADPDEQVAQIAAATLRDAKYIDPEYLPQVRAGLDRKLGWLAPALGRMPSNEAAREAVLRFLVSESAPYNQEAYAVELSGVRAVPAIVELATSTDASKNFPYRNVAHVLHQMDPVSRAATGRGLTAALDAKTPRASALGVLTMIAAIGGAGKDLQAQLLDLRGRRPDLATAIDDALVGVHSDAAPDVLRRRLARHPSDSDDVQATLRELAEFGGASRPAGADVVGLLSADDWNLRLAAARALGFIDYRPAEPALADALATPSDVRLNLLAAESLGRLGDSRAVPALQLAAEGHWYPPVREAAAEALQHIRAGSQYTTDSSEEHFSYEFFNYLTPGTGLSRCERPSVRERTSPPAAKLRSQPDMAPPLALSDLAAPRHDESEAAGAMDRASEHASPDGVEARREVPSVAVRVEGGWLTGYDHGEFGGELLFVGSDHSVQHVLDVNVEDIDLLGGQAVAVTGLRHAFFDFGMLYAVSRDVDGRWKALKWRALPGAPSASWMTDGGDLLIEFVEGGSILVSADGSIRVAPCLPSPGG